jgi:hypothetical protein
MVVVKGTLKSMVNIMSIMSVVEGLRSEGIRVVIRGEQVGSGADLKLDLNAELGKSIYERLITMSTVTKMTLMWIGTRFLSFLT